MEAEPLTPLSLATPLPDSAMTIDYDADPLNNILATEEGGVRDEEMGDDDTNLVPPPSARGGPEVEEAEMADDEASTWEKDAMVEEGAEPVEGVPTQQVDETGSINEIVPEEETLSEVVPESTSIEEVVTAEVTPAEPIASEPSPTRPHDSIPSEAVPEPTESAPTTTTNGDSHEVSETLPIPNETPLSEGEQADAEQSDFPEPSKPSTHDAMSSTKENTTTSVDCSAPSSPFLRPQIDKALLLGIEVPFPDEPQSSSSQTTSARSVFVHYQTTIYSLFRPYEPETGPDDPGEREDEPETTPLLTESQDQHFYLGPLEELFSKLHEEFPELQSREDELVLDFDEIGIALTEDNVYSCQVSLHDFDRIHIGCGLPGRLNARLYTQPRFSIGFNALAQHVANSLTGNSNGTEEDEGEGNDSSATYEAEDDLETVDGEGEGTFPEDHDADGPDSELPILERQEGEGEGQGEVEGEEEFDLESALAQLDGDDVAAYVEGVAEDYILSEGGAKEEEGGEEAKNEAQAEVNEEGSQDQAGEEIAEEKVVEENETGAAGGEEPETQQPTSEAIEESTVQNEQPELEAGAPVEEVASEQVAETPAVGHEDPVDSTSVVEQDQTEQAEDVGDVANEAEADIPQESSTTAAEVPDLAVEGTIPTEAHVVNQTEVPEASKEQDASEPSVVSNASESTEAVVETPILSESIASVEEAIDPNDVVIDYDEAFDGSSSALPPSTEAVLEVTETTETTQVALEEQSMVPPHSPKRRHDSLDADETGEVAPAETEGGDAKRQRLDEPNPESTA